VHVVHGSEDDVSPPAVGRWLTARLAHSQVKVLEGAGHHLLFPRWAALLGCAAGQPA
jgi:pimeloyl-ACP methyl ester carboxylesterase